MRNLIFAVIAVIGVPIASFGCSGRIIAPSNLPSDIKGKIFLELELNSEKLFVQGAKVSLFQKTDLINEVQSGEDGSYEFLKVEPGSYSLKASAILNGFVYQNEQPIIVDGSGKAIKDLDLTLTKQGIVAKFILQLSQS